MEDQAIFEVDAGVETSQKNRVAKLKAERNPEPVQRSLEALALGIDKNENLMPQLIAAVKSYATIGEICGVMRSHWGEFKAPTYI
jgi:methylmalonyl-CoA mutase N-terminal domain/subunit